MVIDDRDLAENLEEAPISTLLRLREYLKAGGQIQVQYGWDEDDDTAKCGCIIGVTLSRNAFHRIVKGKPAVGEEKWQREVLLNLAEKIFPAWASRWVDDVDVNLPPEAIKRLLDIVDETLRRIQ